jgi:hypothetical protein
MAESETDSRRLSEIRIRFSGRLELSIWRVACKAKYQTAGMAAFLGDHSAKITWALVKWEEGS